MADINGTENNDILNGTTGADSIDGNGGNDTINGGAGDDVINGDSGNSLSAGGEGVPGDTLGDGPGSTGGGYDRISAQTVYNGNHSFSTDAFYLGNDIPVLDDANRDAITGVSFSQDGVGTDRTFGLDELEFTGAQRSFVGLVTVQNVGVHNANDQFSSSLSGGFQDVSVVSSGTADFTMNDGTVFQGIRVNFVRGPDGETFMLPDDGPTPYGFNAFRNMLGTNSSGIDSFTIATGSGDDAGINPIEGNWADGQFFEKGEGDGGDDTIIGGEGADQMFGEGGDDTFIVGSAAEGAGDVISGGYGPDETTDNDVLDLTGAGPVTINATADANDAGAQSGTVTFADGSTLTFEGIETIIQDADNTAPTANDDFAATLEGTPVVVNVLDNDTDPEGGDLDIQGTPTAANGTVSVDNETGEITYTPDPGFVGEDTITYTTVDEGGLTDTATLTVSVQDAPLEGPVAVNDNITVFESEGAGDTDGNVLDNDLQAVGEGPYTGGVVTVEGATGNVGEWIDLPDGGRILVNGDGSVDFDADGDFDALNDGESDQVAVDYTIEVTGSGGGTGPNPGSGTTVNVDTTILGSVALGSLGDDNFVIGDNLENGVPAITITGLTNVGFFGSDNDTIDVTAAVDDGWAVTDLIKLPDLTSDGLLGSNGFNGTFVLTKEGALPITVTYTDIENFVGFDTVTSSDDATLTVTIQGENDAPVIDPIGPQSTPENSTDPVFTPTATDPDGDDVTYSLEGPDADLFEIDPVTGEVSPLAPLDFENPTDDDGDGVYDVTVVATDPEGLRDEEPVAITVDDVNEAPVLDDIGPQTAPENSTDPVFTANAVDPDGDQPVYSLTGPDADLFEIDPVTGEVSPLAPLDADNPTDDNGDGVYDVTVVATDPNDPALTDEEPVEITVGDVNEAPVIDPIGPQSTPENSTDPVFTPTATDPDGDDVTYSLEGPDADLFEIDPVTGEVSPLAPLDFENPTDDDGDGVYDVTVVATDPEGLRDEEPVAITVDDVNEAPVLDDIGPQTAPENSTDPVFTANAVDPDGDQPVYSLTGPDADLFEIDPVTGEVSPIAPLDADNPTDDNGDGVYDVTVVATDPNDPALTDEEPVEITVGDVNEAPVIDPIGPQSTPENSTDPVFTPTATDPDGDDVTYSLEGPDADLFEIDPVTGEVSPLAPLDFENPTDDDGDGVYDVTVVATDPEGLRDEEPVAITVDDVNEAPVLDDIGPQTAPENSTDPVFTANAVDPDGDQPVYSLTGPDADLFEIDPVTGEVSPIAPLDADNPTDDNGDGVYDVTVVATDPNDPALTDEEPVEITVGDVNEAPVIDPIGPQSTPENSTDPVFTPTATDPDGDDVTYSLEGPDADLFEIDPVTGEVSPLAPLDFENPTDDDGDGVYDVTVVATDPEGLRDEEPVAITVDDVNEAPVLDDIGPQTAPENSTDPVFTANAVDPDGDQPVYSLTGPDADLFEIDPVTGEVSPLAPLDADNPTDDNGDGVYDVTVVATDPNDPALTDEEPVEITVGDVNEAPVIDPIGPQSTPENSTDPVFTPTATDPDGDDVTYSLEGPDADLFEIDPVTGEVSPLAPLDFENPTDDDGDGVYDVTVVATDPEGLRDEEPVAITVDDVNEAPVLDDIGPQTAPENSTDPVFTANAVDPDGDQPVYSLTGPDADLFEIDPVTGEVSPIAPLDADNPTDDNGDGVYDVTVVATDPNDPALTDEEPVEITVGDVNEAPVIDPIGPQSTPENSTDPVFTPTATDPDGDDVTYSLEGPDADLFEIDPVTGEVSPLAPLDFENPTDDDGDGVYDVTVVATDPEGLRDEEPVAITVTNVAEPDGPVDGLEIGEVMDPGYVDEQGDEIDGADGLDDIIFGNGGDDTIDAGLGDDTVDGGTGDDSIFGNEGQDSIDGGEGDDTIDGGADNDTITGGDGNDTVEGGDGDDVIDTSNPNDDALPDVGYPEQDSATIPGLTFPGYGEDQDPNDDKDSVSGGAGNDSIITGDDDDIIDGGAGDDTIAAGFDDDTVTGGIGNDFIEGGEGNDSVDGGDGNDTIYGGLQDPRADAVSFPDDEPDAAGFQDLVTENNGDMLFGGAGDDTIYGQDDDDSLYGGEGSDALYGGVDDDVIEGNDGDDLIVGGQGADDLSGGLGSDTFVVDEAGDGTGDVVVGGEDPDDSDNDVLDLTGSDVASIVYTDDDPATESGVVTFADGGTLTFSEIETVIPCFTPGTLIATSKGERLVEELQAGDRVITRDNGFQEIAWVGEKQLTAREMNGKTDLRPIFVKAGSFGNGLPERDMMLSPNHKVLLADDEAELYFEEREVLVAAKHLVGKAGIHQVDVAQTTYIHFMFERHEVVLSDGSWTESFHPGDYSLNGIDEEARAEILALFPELATDEGLKDYRLARTELKKHEARLLLR